MSGGTILVTGAAGFVGRHLCAKLKAEGISYVSIDTQASDLGSPVDLRDRSAVAGLFEQQQIAGVIHLAAILPTAARRNPQLATEVNIDASCNLIDEAAKAGVKRFLFGSSMGIYGREGKNVPLDEEIAPTPSDVYGGAKRYVELYGENLGQTGGFAFVSLRIATVVGLGVRNTASPWRSQIFDPAVQQVHIPCGSDAMLSLVHVEDVAEMLFLLASRETLLHTRYNTPAENWRSGDLKRTIESLPGSQTIVLQDGIGSPTPPVSNGASFAAEFHYRARPILDRLQAARRPSEALL